MTPQETDPDLLVSVQGSLVEAWVNGGLLQGLQHELEKEMATHSSVLAWRIPGMGEPGGLPSMGSLRVGQD